MEFSHVDKEGNAKMVDVSGKSVTRRVAVAESFIRIRPDVLTEIMSGKIPKGDVLTVAKIAGIQAAKRTSELIPLCHTLNIENVDIEMKIEENGVRVISSVTVTAKTGAEMEALTAASVAALTIYDMCKSTDKSMNIENIHLVEKYGGQSGHFIRRIPRQKAKVVGCSISKSKGMGKKNVGTIELVADHGVNGDAHFGTIERQVSLIGIETIMRMRDEGHDVGIGDFAENITTEGVILKEIPVGTPLKIGDIELEVVQIGKDCHTGCEIRKKIGDCPMPREGIFASIRKGGQIHVGDTIEIF